MLEVRRPIVNFLWYWESYLMRLQVVYMEVLELNPRQGIFDCLVPTLMQVPTKADSITKERSCKRGAVGARGAGRMYRSDLHTSRGRSWWPKSSERLA